MNKPQDKQDLDYLIKIEKDIQKKYSNVIEKISLVEVNDNEYTVKIGNTKILDYVKDEPKKSFPTIFLNVITENFYKPAAKAIGNSAKYVKNKFKSPVEVNDNKSETIDDALEEQDTDKKGGFKGFVKDTMGIPRFLKSYVTDYLGSKKKPKSPEKIAYEERKKDDKAGVSSGLGFSKSIRRRVRRNLKRINKNYSDPIIARNRKVSYVGNVLINQINKNRLFNRNELITDAYKNEDQSLVALVK